MPYSFTFAGSDAPRDRVRAAVTAAVPGLDHETLRWREEGEWVEVALDDSKTIGAAEIRVRANAYGVAARSVPIAVALADAISAATGWRPHDPQKRSWLDEDTHAWRAEVALAAHDVDGLDRRGELLLVSSSRHSSWGHFWIWGLREGRPLPVPNDRMYVLARFWDDGRLLVASGDGSRYFDRLSLGGRRRDPSVAVEPCANVIALPGGRALTSRGQLVDVAAGTVIRTLPVNSATGNAFVAASPDGARVVLDHDVHSVEDGALVCRLALEGHYPGAVAFTAAGDRIVSGGLEKRIAVFDARTGAVTATMDRCGQVWSVDTSPDGALFASGPETPRARLWTVDGEARKDLAATGTPLAWDGIRGAHCAGAKESGRKVAHIRFIDERRVAVAFNDGRVCIYDTKTRRPLVTLGMFDGGRWIALAPNGDWDGSEGLDRVQWAWSTDQRTYRDVVALDPARRRAGLLSEVCGSGRAARE